MKRIRNVSVQAAIVPSPAAITMIIGDMKNIRIGIKIAVVERIILRRFSRFILGYLYSGSIILCVLLFIFNSEIIRRRGPNKNLCAENYVAINVVIKEDSR